MRLINFIELIFLQINIIMQKDVLIYWYQNFLSFQKFYEIYSFSGILINFNIHWDVDILLFRILVLLKINSFLANKNIILF